jgi:peptide deformylase
MSDIKKNQCPCCSEKTYENCCFVFHEGKLPENALQLMRSRYSAYVLNIPEYIIETTHPASPQYSEDKFSWRRSILKFSRAFTFNKLKILDFKEQKNFATVTFTAYISQDSRDSTFTEKSYFEKVKNRWLYRGGQLAEGHAPNLVTTAQLRLLPLAYYGDPILRKKADPVVDISKDLEKLVEEMIETMDSCNGMGLAAPQVHHSIRLFITRFPVETEKGNFEKSGVRVFINPKISSKSTETWKTSEGCLSIPTIHADVKRSQEIEVEFLDLKGNSHVEKFSGWEARVVLHENDHLDGVLFIDHLDRKKLIELEPFLKKLKKRIHDGSEL